jgi:hypothetical protein
MSGNSSDLDSAAAAEPAAPAQLVTLRKKLNPLYGRLFDEVFDRPEVVETRATCETCAMCDQGQLAPVEMEFFSPSSKCCTWHPTLPNYLVGAVLADTSEDLAEGRKRLRARIAARIGVTPGFIAPPRKYNVIYTAARGSGFFGRAPSMLCPYYDSENDGRCTVWQYRESVCSTYFCKYTAGKPGWEFWDQLKGYLSHVEATLSRSASLAVDSTVSEPPQERTQLTKEDVEDLPPNDADYARFWGNGKWVGREEEFYIACYEKVRTMTRAEYVEKIDDTPLGRGMIARLTSRYDKIPSTETPKHLVLIRSNQMRKRVTDDAVVVTTYNPYDAFSMEKDLFEVLRLLKREETLEQNLARLDREHDVQLAPELIHYLYVHGVLVEPEEAKEAAEKEKRQPKPLPPVMLTTRQQRRLAKRKQRGE